MDQARVRALVDYRRARGLEVGALDRPILTKDMGPIEYVDRAPRSELQRWYGAGAHVEAERIVEVDHVWGDQDLLSCVGGERAFDYLLASHVIEHVPDLLGWLGEIAAVLKDGGQAVFVVPDKRYTFDVLRRTTSEAEVIDAFVRRLRRPYPRQIFDHFFNHHDVHTDLARAPRPDETERAALARHLIDTCRDAVEGAYIDSHCWVFTPRSMVRLLDFASLVGVLPFEIATLEPTRDGADDFLLALRRLPEATDRQDRRAAFVASCDRLVLPPEERSYDADARILTAKAQAAIGRARAIEASTSWRLTAPLRRLVDAARRLRRRGGSAISS